MRSVYLKTLYDKRFFLLGWTLGFTALTMLMVAFFPAMRVDGGIDELVKNTPAAFKGLVGDLANLDTFSTYIASQLFDIRLPLIAGIMSIILGFSLSTNEEEAGELRSIMALPISRMRLFMEKWCALCTIMGLSSLAFFGGVYATSPFVEGATIEFQALASLVLMTLLLMICFGTITFSVGMAFGKKGIANAIGVIVIIGSFILTTFGKAVEWLEPFEKFSLLHYFPAVEVVKGDIEWLDVSVLASIIIVCLVISTLAFTNRDIS